ncbi:MAG TPA: hemerythrin domain-containing protein [Pyrinomonadaceae bacterium]|nr:hemerythrin domain-containing protein [Pyrinomonadaceae bacterium]
MDAFELLKADHKKVNELFDQLEAATGKAKLNVFNQIKTELELHTHIEEKIFYPALEKPEETHDLTLEAYEEHKMVKTLLSKLSGARTADDEWQAQAKVLRENVEHHVEEEENELFDKADDALSDEEIEALGQRMEAEKARKQGRPAQRSTTKKKGIVSRIAEFVGLGSSSSSKKSGPAKKGAAKKESARKATTKNSATKKRASKKAASTTKRASKSAASKRSSRSKKSATKKRRR